MLEQWAEGDAVIRKSRQWRGVGLVTAVTMRAEIGPFDRFQSGTLIARFCGVTPRNASSGARQADAALNRASNPKLRRVLIELAHRVTRAQDGRWPVLAHKLLRQGKKNVVAAAVANRWVPWLHHQMQPEHLAA